MGFGEAACRSTEFGQRQRGAQFEAACALQLRDDDGGQESVLRLRGIGGVALQQDIAPGLVQFGFKCAMTDPLARRQRLVEDRKRTLEIACASFGFS